MEATKKKVCMFFNDLALYRKAIYKMLDEEYDCDWYIEDIDTGVKEFDESELKKVERLPVKSLGPFYRVDGLSKILKKNYEIYFMLGATRNLSLITFCLKKIIFYPQKRVYFWTHGYYGKESWIEKTLWKRPIMKFADAIFTYGDYARKLMIDDGFDEKRIYPIHNSLDYEHQLNLRKEMAESDIYSSHFNNKNPVLIFIGRLTEIKRLDLFLEAVGVLNNQGESYNVIFVGDGSEKQNLESLTYKLGIQEQVWFYGACYDEKTNAELIYNADLCIAPGNIGLTSIHALMFGCPAISHDRWDLQMPEFEAIKPSVTGDFFKYGSVDDLALKIHRWFENNKDRKEEVRNACYEEIDTNWNPYYQMNIISKNLK